MIALVGHVATGGKAAKHQGFDQQHTNTTIIRYYSRHTTFPSNNHPIVEKDWSENVDSRSIDSQNLNVKYRKMNACRHGRIKESITLERESGLN